MPLDPDLRDPRGRQRMSALVLAVTDDDFVRHEPPPDLWHPVADRIAGDRIAEVGHGGVRRGDAVGPATPPQVVTSLDVRCRGVVDDVDDAIRVVGHAFVMVLVSRPVSGILFPGPLPAPVR